MKDFSHYKVDVPAAPWKTHAQWMQSAGGKYLHFVAPLTKDEDEHGRACSAPGVPRIALCGLRMRCFIPGLGMRMGGARCERCCDKMSLPWGYGTPANEVARWRKFFMEEKAWHGLTSDSGTTSPPPTTTVSTPTAAAD